MNFYENLLEAMSKDDAEKLISSLTENDYHAVLLNTNFISDKEFKTLFPNVKPHPIVKNAFIYDKKEYELGKSIYHELGYFYLQEPSAMVVASLLNFNEGDLVLDMCAAPGGKTIQSALRGNNKITIIANDISRTRAEIISNNVERLGLENIIITANDFSKNFDRFLNTFDKIILDAPCSGSGMFRKDVKMQDDWSFNKVLKNSQIQKDLISIAYSMLKPGGILCYSTCSYSKEEDEDVIHFIMNTADAKLVNMPEFGYTNLNDPLGRRLMPSIFPGEGQYVCLLEKPGQLKANGISCLNKYKNVLPKILDNKNIVKFNEIFFMNDRNFNTATLPVLRYGVKIGEFSKNILHYDLHFARCLKYYEFPKLELTIDEVKKYLEGNTLPHPSNLSGNILLTYLNNPIDIAKTDGSTIKNHYPKGLRKKFI